MAKKAKKAKTAVTAKAAKTAKTVKKLTKARGTAELVSRRNARTHVRTQANDGIWGRKVF